MAETPTAEQTEVRRRGRQRLIGAVVIVLLAVVFVPMILDPEPRKETQEPSLAIPPKDSAPPLPAPLPPAKVVEAPAPKADAPKADAAKPDPAKPDAAKVVAPKSTEFMSAAAPAKVPSKDAAAKPATSPVPAVAPKLEGYAVQVGAFKEEDKLKQARERLAGAKIPHFTERLASSDLTRLRAGPFPTKEAAEQALASVKLAGLDGKVVPLP